MSDVGRQKNPPHAGRKNGQLGAGGKRIILFQNARTYNNYKRQWRLADRKTGGTRGTKRRPCCFGELLTSKVVSFLIEQEEGSSFFSCRLSCFIVHCAGFWPSSYMNSPVFPHGPALNDAGQAYAGFHCGFHDPPRYRNCVCWCVFVWFSATS